MKIRFYTLFVVLFILSCGFGEISHSIQEKPSISSAVALIKKYVNAGNREIVGVRIVNSHNGHYTIRTSIWSGPDRVRLITYIVDVTGGKRDTTFILPKKDFLFKLDKASYPINSIVFAGHRQTVSVTKNELEKTFETTDGRSLMTLLEYGE